MQLFAKLVRDSYAESYAISSCRNHVCQTGACYRNLACLCVDMLMYVDYNYKNFCYCIGIALLCKACK